MWMTARIGRGRGPAPLRVRTGNALISILVGTTVHVTMATVLSGG